VTDLSERHCALAFLTDALFCSELEIGSTPSEKGMAAAIYGALKAHLNWDGCTRAVAAAFCEDIASATRREAWCRQLAAQALDAGDITSGFDGRA